ncbi:MAG: EamA family transporter [bacterium]
MASLLIAIGGMVSIYGWSLTSSQIFPATMTVLAGLMGATTVILPKKLIGNYHELQMMAGYFLLQVVFNLPLSIWLSDPIPPMTLNEAWGGQLGYAVAMLVANMAAITGFGYLEPSIGSLIGLAEILFGILFGIVLFGESLSVGVMVGGLLILLAAALPSVAEVLGRRQTSARASTLT